MKDNILLDKSFAFAIRVTNAHKHLTRECKEFVLSRQLLRSGTSIGANAEEAIGTNREAISSANFQSRTKKRERLVIGFAFFERRVI